MGQQLKRQTISNFKTYGISVSGKSKSINEDAYLIDEELRLLCVADGVGGIGNGEHASHAAIEAVRDYFYENRNRNPEESTSIELSKYIQSKLNKLKIECATTIAVAIAINDKVHLFHAGDTKIFISFKNGETWSSRDDSIVQELVDQGIIDESKAWVHPKRNIITKCFSNQDLVEPSLSYKCFKLSNVDKILVVSDGLFEYHNPKKLFKIIQGIIKSESELADSFNLTGLPFKDDTTLIYSQKHVTV